MTEREQDVSYLPNLKRAIRTLELGSRRGFAGVVVWGIGCEVIRVTISQRGWGAALGFDVFAAAALVSGVIIGAWWARRVRRIMVETPDSYVNPFSTQIRPRRRGFSLEGLAWTVSPSRAAAALGTSVEEYREWRRHVRAAAWKTAWVAGGGVGFWVGIGGSAVGELLFGHALTPWTAAATGVLAALPYSTGLSIVLLAPVAKVLLTEPLERETGLSVVEVMREFGYRPARIIGWRRIREQERSAATPTN